LACAPRAVRLGPNVGLLDRELVVVELAEQARGVVLVSAIPFPTRAGFILDDFASRVVFERTNRLVVAGHCAVSRPRWRRSLAEGRGFELQIKESPARGPGSSGGFKISRSGRKSSSEKKYSNCNWFHGQEVSRLTPLSPSRDTAVLVPKTALLERQSDLEMSTIITMAYGSYLWLSRN